MDTTPDNSQLDVLIIEDEIDICYLLSGILKKKNLHTAYVTSLTDANLALNTQNPDILFIDNHLPDGLGVDFIHFVKKYHPKTRIVMISAYDTNSDKEKAKREGVDYFIGKPFTREIINQTVDALMKDFG